MHLDMQARLSVYDVDNILREVVDIPVLPPESNVPHLLMCSFESKIGYSAYSASFM